MASNNTDFLRFSAYSIKELITRKLSQDSTFTDQVYEGSNLAILIDIFSYMAQCLLYSLNNAASESMFSDTQIYENINRLCKFIGYHPKGCSTAIVEFALNNTDHNYTGKIIPKYAYIDTALTDNNGRKIYYSVSESCEVNSNENFSTLFYNGRWQVYSTVFQSSGEKNQQFILSDLKSDFDKEEYVPTNGIHVYIDVESSSGSSLEQYTVVSDGIFVNTNKITGVEMYSSEDRIVDLRLNENKQYELTFGNGFNGKIPEKGALIYIIYLTTNGPGGKITSGSVLNQGIRYGSNTLGVSDEFYSKLISISNINVCIDSSSKWTNIANSTEYVEEESVDKIRENAPEWFKIGNRLVTARDFEYYFKNNNNDFLVDIKCQNNWEYITTFYRWLYNLSLSGNYVKYEYRKPASNYYINQNRLIKYDFTWADAADSNNVYLWIKTNNNSINNTMLLKNQFDLKIQNIKLLTSEPVYLLPLTLYFSPCAAPIDKALRYFDKTNTDYEYFDSANESYIEITLDDSYIFTAIDIQLAIANTIIEFFNESNLTLGMVVDLNVLTQKIYDLGSIAQIRTVYRSGEDTVIISGLSFATWTGSLLDIGEDLTVSPSMRSLEPFQFPALYRSASLVEKIKVIRKSISTTNTIQY